MPSYENLAGSALEADEEERMRSRNSHIPYPQLNTDEFRPAHASTPGSTYAALKSRMVAGATHLRERDWTRERDMANKAASATKGAAVASGTWLGKMAKQGVDRVNAMRGAKPPSKPDSPPPYSY